MADVRRQANIGKHNCAITLTVPPPKVERCDGAEGVGNSSSRRLSYEMAKSKIILHTLQYTKAELDKAPANDRLFILMATGLANDIQMLNKTLAVIIDNEDADSSEIEKQGNNAFAILILKMLCGRLSEGWKLVSNFSQVLKQDYEPSMSADGRSALKALRSYFSGGNGRKGLIQAVRDKIAFHSDRHVVEAAYNSLDPSAKIGDYLHEKIGNTLYYTAEIIQFESLASLSGGQSIDEALGRLLDETKLQTRHFNDTIYGFALVFCERHLPDALAKLAEETDTIEVCRFNELNLRYFSELDSSNA